MGKKQKQNKKRIGNWNGTHIVDRRDKMIESHFNFFKHRAQSNQIESNQVFNHLVMVLILYTLDVL